jgi:type I restriction enzyme M protein
VLLHGVENPDIRYRDSLAQDHAGEEKKYTLVLANPPFAGSLDYENCAKDLQQIVKTKKTELLFLALFKPGGRAAVIVPDGVLIGSSNAHKTLRKILVEEQKLDAVRVQALRWRLHRHCPFHQDQLGRHGPCVVLRRGCRRHVARRQTHGTLVAGKAWPCAQGRAYCRGTCEKKKLPDILTRWKERNKSERERSRTAQSFCIPQSEIRNQSYELSLNRYKEVVHEEVAYRTPQEILAELAKQEAEIQQGMKELEGMLK